MKGSLAVSSSRISHCCQIFMQASRPDTPAMPVPLRCCASGRLSCRWEKMVPAQTRKLRRLEEGPKLGPHRKAAEVNRDEVNRDDHRDKGGWAQ